MSMDRINAFAHKIEELMPGLPRADEIADNLPDLAERSRAVGRALSGPRQDARRALEGLPEDARRALEALPEGARRALAGLPEDVRRKLEDLPEDVRHALDDLPQDARRAWDGLPQDIRRNLESLPNDVRRALDDLPKDARRAFDDLPVGRPARDRGPDARVIIAGVAVAGLAAGVLLGRADREQLERWRDRAVTIWSEVAGWTARTLRYVVGAVRGALPAPASSTGREAAARADESLDESLREARQMHAIEGFDASSSGDASAEFGGASTVTVSSRPRPALGSVEKESISPSHRSGS
ncbi:hypothetical protein BH24CHL9_BH24CHL9_11090 [soil metagenome]